jgi:hypothetical protein
MVVWVREEIEIGYQDIHNIQRESKSKNRSCMRPWSTVLSLIFLKRVFQANRLRS